MISKQPITGTRSSSESKLRLLKSFFLLSFLLNLFLLPIANMAWGANLLAAPAQLHIPWSVIQNDLLKTWQASSGSLQFSPGNQTYNIAGYPVLLSGINVTGSMSLAAPTVGPSMATVQVPAATFSVVIQSLQINQTIQQVISGVTINVNLQIQCGPILLSQSSTQGSVQFAIDWSQSVPITNVSQLNVTWPTGSWQISNFNCTGPAGTTDTIRNDLAASLTEPSYFKPFLATALSSSIQNDVNQLFKKITQPLTVSTGSSSVTMVGGNAFPVATGALLNISVLASPQQTPIFAGNAPLDPNAMSQLPTSSPALIAGLNALQMALQNELSAQPAWITSNLQNNSSFHSLINNWFAEFFVWPDLMNYASNLPFYLNVQIPKTLPLSAGGQFSVTAPVPIQAIIQSYRDQKWWSYLTISGSAQGQTQVSVQAGLLGYSTSFSKVAASIQTGAAYAAQYGSVQTLPTSNILSSISGKQAALSGSKALPGFQLNSSLSYIATKINWTDSQTFFVEFDPK